MKNDNSIINEYNKNISDCCVFKDDKMIIFYTGTGNSKYVAKAISEQIGDVCLDLFERIRHKDYSSIASDRPWIVVCPTYAWQIPHILRDWIMKTEFVGRREIYFVMTCGGDIGNAGKYCRKLCETKGLKYKGIKAVRMPENYIAMFDAPEETKAKEIVQSADPVIKQISSVILNDEDLNEPVGLLDKVKSSITNDAFYAMAIRDRKFVVGKDCTHCGLCEKLCPLGNIELKDGKPVWRGNCTHCMACICHCPEGAIEYGKASIGKPRYKCPY